MNRRFRWNDAPTARGIRASEASAGAPGERGVPTASGVNPEEEAFDQGRRRIRLHGRDQETNQLLGAEIYLPSGGHGFGSGLAKVGDATIGAEALDHPERTRDGCQEISAIAELQRRLNAFYASK
jgi:hypothetical protein